MSKEKKGHRLLCFGAHPDDCEMQASGLAAFWTGAGGAARFVSMTDGSSRINDYHPDEAVARFTREVLTTQPSERFLQDFGGIRPSSADAPGAIGYAMARRWFRTFKRLWTEQMRRHSLSAACIPRPEKRRQRRLALMLPKTGSVVILRLAWVCRPSAVARRSSICLLSTAGSARPARWPASNCGAQA